MPDGQFVEVHPDSLESDSARKARPQFKSDAGRVVYGGGAVTPDLLVQADTLSTAEQEFRKAMAPKSQEYYVALYDLAYELKSQVKPDFIVKPEWRSDFLSRLEKAGVKVDRKQWDAASTLVDRDLELRIARTAFGDSTVRRRTLDEDPQLRKAIEIIQKGQSQKDLFALVAPRSQR
jgi:carboxyl-terminal processing protease